MCQNLPIGLNNIAGIFEMECANGLKVPSLPYDSNIIKYVLGTGATDQDYMIPILPSKYPLDALSNELRWVNNTWQPQGNKLAFMVFKALTKSLDQFSVQFTFQKKPTTADLSQCKIKYLGVPSITGKTLTDKFGNPPTGFTSTSIVPSQVDVDCTNDKITFANNNLKNITDLLNVDTYWGLLIDALWYSGWMFMSSNVESCKNYLDQKLTSIPSQQLFPSTSCIYGTQTQEWLADACCNPPLAEWGNKCCVEKNISQSIQKFQSTVSKVTSKCSTSDKSKSLLQDYISLRNLFLDPVEGCTKNAEQFSNYKLLNGELEELFYCYNHLIQLAYGQYLFVPTGVPTQFRCFKDSDCLCSRCDIETGSCLYCNSTATDQAILKCFQNRTFPQNIENLARAEFGLFNSTKDQFYAEFYNRVKTQTCVAPNSTVYSDLSQTDCLAMGTCKNVGTNFEYVITNQNSCNNQSFNGICEVCSYEGYCTQIPFGDICIVNNSRYSSKTICEQNSFKWNGFENICFTSLSMQDCQCNTGQNDQICMNGYCYIQNVTQSNCISNSTIDPAYKYWKNGTNVCILNVNEQFYCGKLGGTWVEGKTWRSRNPTQFNVNSKSDCESLDICLVNNQIQVGNCDKATECNGLCPKCESNLGYQKGACYSQTIQDSSTCVTQQGFWNEDDKICLFQFNQSLCSSTNNVWEVCDGLNYNTCESCSNLESSCSLKAKNALGCFWNTQSRCQKTLTGSQCESNGYCFDQSEYPSCAYLTASIDVFGCPICLYSQKIPFSFGNGNVAALVDGYGNVTGIDTFSPDFYSSLDLYSINGCLTKSVKKSECVQNGGRWVDSAQTKETCLSVTGCIEPIGNNNCQYKNDLTLATLDDATNKSQAECVGCGGKYGSLYSWVNARNDAATRYYTVWKTNTWESLYKYQNYVTGSQLTFYMSRFLFRRAQLSIFSSIECELSPIFETAVPIYCDCNLKKKKGSCFPPIFTNLLGQNFFCRGENLNVRFGISEFRFQNLSVSSSDYCIQLTARSVGATQFQNKAVITSSALLASLSKTDNQFAVVKNKKGLIIGQLLTDGLMLDISKAAFVSNIQSSTTQKRKAENNNFTVCINARTDIDNDKATFPLLDFAYSSDFKTWTPLNANVVFDGQKYCGTLNTNSTTIFAVSLTKNWQNVDSIFVGNIAVRNLLYFMSACMFILFGGCIVALIFHFVKDKGFSIPKLCLFLIAIYSGLRAVFFLLFAIGTLTSLSQSNPSGFFVIGELPYYVFLSLFVLVVVFWAVSSRITKKSALKRLFWPILIPNILLYTFFVIVCIVNATINSSAATTLNKIYKCIVALIAFAIVVLALIYGSIWINTTYKGWKTTGKKIPSHLVKTSIILLITAIALILQISYLLYSAFAAHPSIPFAATIYFLAEVIPVIILFILFAPPKVTKGSRTSKKGNEMKSNEVK